ncbi:MAG: hypothetical protein U5O15_06980 [Candidatus Krumholzibacteriota bacterium]|nr:hypothetical protein [Candidatus Krumholzibacteriota bacterium]
MTSPKNMSASVKDMILQLLVKGDAAGFKRYTKDGTIHPFAVEPETLSRDMAVMGALTISFFLIIPVTTLILSCILPRGMR